jgi:hypothetical protein
MGQKDFNSKSLRHSLPKVREKKVSLYCGISAYKIESKSTGFLSFSPSLKRFERWNDGGVKGWYATVGSVIYKGWLISVASRSVIKIIIL